MLTQTNHTRPNRPLPQPLARLCTVIEDVAIRQGLPGKGGAVSSAAPSRAASGGKKSGWAAPSADLLRSALAELPNQPGGAFDARDKWVELAHAVKGASVAAGIEADGRDAFVEWSRQWGGDPDDPGRVWDGIAAPHTGWGTLMRVLEQVNPAGAARVKHATAQAAFAAQAAQNQAAIAASPFAPVIPMAGAQIPPRQWLYGRSAIKGFLSYLVAPGGAGKSSLALVRAVAMASGRALLSGEAPVRPLRVWMHNAEDDAEEMHRRLAATLQHFGLTHADLGGNLFMTSGRDMKLQLAKMDRNGPEVVPGVVEALVERALAAKLDVLLLDPLGALHTLPENSNEAANLLSAALREIAHRAGVSVIVLHHTGKAAAMDMGAAGAGASRGASAFVDAARVVEQLVCPETEEAARLGIAEEDRRFHLRIANGKANLSPAVNGRWIHLANVALGNGAGLWPMGDHVGVAESWTPPAANLGTATDLARVQAALSASPRPCRADQRSPDWVGWLVANAMALDVGGPDTPAKDRTPPQAAAFHRVRAMLAAWIKGGQLMVTNQRDPCSRKDFRVVVPGTPAVLLDPAEAYDSDETNEKGEAE